MITLQPGQPAPDFIGTIQNGSMVSLSNYRGHKLALYFYPKDNTPGCNKEACSLRDGYEELSKHNIKILGVSPDSAGKHGKFIAKFNLPFDLIADTDKVIMNDYGVWGEKKLMGRTYNGVHRVTFLIDEQGIIEKIIMKVKTNDHANQILEELGLTN